MVFRNVQNSVKLCVNLRLLRTPAFKDGELFKPIKYGLDSIPSNSRFYQSSRQII